MYQVFNMGHRLEFYVRKEVASDIIAICDAFQLKAKIVGEVLDSEKKQLTIRDAEGEYVYT